MPDPDLKTNQTIPSVTDNGTENQPTTTTVDENNTAPRPNDTTTTGNPPQNTTTTGTPPQNTTTTGTPPQNTTTTGNPPQNTTTTGNPPPNTTTTGNPPQNTTTTRNPQQNHPQVNTTTHDTPEGKFGENFASPVIKPDGENNERNTFLKKEYVDTYDKEQEYDAATTDEQKQALLEEMRTAAQGAGQGGQNAAQNGGQGGGQNAAQNAAQGAANGGIGAALQSNVMGKVVNGADALLDTASLGMGINQYAKASKAESLAAIDKDSQEAVKAKEASDDAEKASNIGSIATNGLGLVTGGINTYRDSINAYNAARGGNKGDVHSNNLAIAADAFGLGSNVTGIVGSSVGLAGGDKKGIAGFVGDSFGTIGNILSMSGSADKVRRQNTSLGKLKAIKNDNTASAERKQLASDYAEATKAKRWSSGFNTGAGVANSLASMTSIVGDAFGAANNKSMAALLGFVGTIIGLVGKGLSFFGGIMENKRKKQNKDSIVRKYVKDQADKVKRHGRLDVEGKLSDVEKENIAIARMGCNVTDFSKEGQKETFKDKIFKHIGDIRVAAAKQDHQLLETMGLANDASDEVIRDALGYGE